MRQTINFEIRRSLREKKITVRDVHFYWFFHSYIFACFFFVVFELFFFSPRFLLPRRKKLFHFEPNRTKVWTMRLAYHTFLSSSHELERTFYARTINNLRGSGTSEDELLKPSRPISKMQFLRRTDDRANIKCTFFFRTFGRMWNEVACGKLSRMEDGRKQVRESKNTMRALNILTILQYTHSR